MNLPDPASLIAADRAIPGGLVARLAAAGYGPDTITAAEREVPTVLGAARLPLVEAALGAGGIPGALPAALFCYGIRVRRPDAEAALGADAVAALVAAGALREADGDLSSPWRIVPFLGTMVASDHGEAGADAVMGPGPTTAALAQAGLPAAGARVLDLGCGAGSLALAAMRAGAASGCAIDINPRAVEVARANAVLNRLELDCRCGDLLAPVAGERFDLVLSQPPYVIRPAAVAAVTYLHSGARGDELARRILAEVPGVLADGGLALVHYDGPGDRDATMLGEFARAARARVDIAVLVQPGMPVAVQAMGYASLMHGGFTAGYATAVRDYIAHCRAAGFSTFGRYTVALRRSARGWAVRIPLSSSRGPQRAIIDRLLAGLDLAESPDAAILARRVGPDPDARLVLHRGFGSPEVSRIEVAYAGSPWPAHDIDENTAALCDMLAAADSVGAAAAAYAEACELPPAEATATMLGFVRNGLRRGALAIA